MIKVERGIKPLISDALLNRARQDISEWYRQPDRIRNKRLLQSSAFKSVTDQSRNALLRVFHRKCAYCESPVGANSEGDVERFRPLLDATNLEGEGSPDHYAWLGCEWDNLYLVCAGCSRAKRTLFPVTGKRAPPLMPLDKVRQLETALLLDPCLDEPDIHLRFNETGFAEALSLMGETTIKVLNLNREYLVVARSRVWRNTTSLFRADQSEADIAKIISPNQPYSAVANCAYQAFRATLKTSNAVAPQLSVRSVPAERRSADQILEADAVAFRLSARHLRRVEVKNFRAMRDIVIDFVEPGAGPAPWLMLLGENASGKSTLLQAIALALAGTDEARLYTAPKKLLTAGAFQGWVKLWFWDQESPVELGFNRNDKVFSGNKRPSAIVLAYGALRYAQRRAGGRDKILQRFSKIAPIMQAVSHIPYPVGWLLKLTDSEFDSAARAIQAILPDTEGAVMYRSKNRVYFNVKGHHAILAELSAGYQAVIGICADIMKLLFERWETFTSATAIVLVDELDAHLHPRWSMRIVGALRQAFPQVQFIASTHDPLVLRGLRNNEVVLLRRGVDGSIIADQNLPPLEGMQVDQLLTSRVFGLSSTMDPETQALIDEYYFLRSQRSDAGHDLRMAEIRQRVGDSEALGRNKVEQLMLDAAGEYIRQTESFVQSPSDLQLSTRDRLLRIAERRAARIQDEKR